MANLMSAIIANEERTGMVFFFGRHMAEPSSSDVGVRRCRTGFRLHMQRPAAWMYHLPQELILPIQT